MSSPYRTRSGLAPPQAPRDTGIVGDIIDQFADRYAFLRELVQNAIDAETPAIEVDARYDHGEQRMTIAIHDQGTGMPRDVIENRLLVLFRSTKEDDDQKIGKFGVGFASVLALDPTLVKVTTSHAGERHTLHLFSDLSYELFENGPATRTGTSVEVEIELGQDEVQDFLHCSLEALVRWCRHASVPIHFTGDAHPIATVERTAIVTPLALEDALFQVSHEARDGMRAVVGLAADGAAYAGFFNHGLTLFETREPLAGNIAFKVQDPRLGHTLSRDNVRRDARFDAAIDFVSRVASDRLVHAATDALADACRQSDSGRFYRLADAVLAAGLKPKWVLPLVEEVDGSTMTTLVQWVGAGGYTSAGRTPVTAFLATKRVPVVKIDGTSNLISRAFSRQPRPIAELTLVVKRETNERERALLERTRELLDSVHRAPASIFFADLEGFAAGQPHISSTERADEIEAPFLLDLEEIDLDPFALFRRRSIAINRDAPVVRRIAAVSDGERSASLLARLILLGNGALSIRRSEVLLDLALEAAGIDR